MSVQTQQLLANDTDPEQDALSIVTVGNATNGLVALDGATIIYRHDGSENDIRQLHIHRLRRRRQRYRPGRDRCQSGQRSARRRR